MTDLSERLAQIRAGNSQLGRRPSTLSLGSCGSSRSSLSPVSSGRSVSSPMSVSSSSSSSSSASRSSSNASMQEAKRVTTRRTQSSDTRRTETLTQRRITEKRVTASSTPRPPTGRKSAPSTTIRQQQQTKSTATVRGGTTASTTTGRSASSSSITAGGTTRKPAVPTINSNRDIRGFSRPQVNSRPSIASTRSLSANSISARSASTNNSSSIRSASANNSSFSRTATSNSITSRSTSSNSITRTSTSNSIASRSVSANNSSSRNFSGETARSRSSQMDTSNRSTALGSRSISSHRSQSSSMLLPTENMETNKHKVEIRPSGKYSYRSYSANQISQELDKDDDYEPMSQPEDLSPTAPPHNRFSYRSFSSNQIMSDLSKLCEEEDFPNSPRWNSTVGGKNDFAKDDFRMPRDNSTRTSFDNLNKQKESYNQQKGTSTRTSFDNLNEAARNQFSHRSFSSNQISDTISNIESGRSSVMNASINDLRNPQGNQFSYRSSSTSQLLADLSKQLEAELQRQSSLQESKTAGNSAMTKSAVVNGTNSSSAGVANQFSYRSFSTGQLHSDLNTADLSTAHKYSKDRSSSYASRDASQERKTTTHSLFDNDANEFENTNLQLFSNILSNISGSRQSRFTSNSSSNLEAISEDSSRMTASKLFNRARATDNNRQESFSGSLLSLGQLTSSQQSLNSQISTTSDVNPRQIYKPNRKPLFDNMTDENLEEYEDARNNNSTADHVTKYNQINKNMSNERKGSVSRQNSNTSTTSAPVPTRERSTSRARPARRTSTERLVKRSSSEMSSCCMMTSSQLVSNSNRKISNTSSVSDASRKSSVESGCENININNNNKNISNNQTGCNNNLTKMSLSEIVNSNLTSMNGKASMSSQQSLTSQLSTQEIKQRIGNRATKTVTPGGARSCYVCKRDIGEDGVFALGNLFHKQCLRCGCCGSKIESKFFTRNGKPCCPKCAKLAKAKCRVCELDIHGDHVESGDSMYHPHCMKCYKCGTLATENFFTHQGQPVCEEHSQELIPNCVRCDNKIVGAGFSRGDEIICNECMEAEGQDVCSKCSKEIKGETLALGPLKLHKACLFCVLCKENMHGKQVSLDKQNNIYCAKDYDRKFANQCYYCKKSIVPRPGETKAPRIRALDKDFHIGCFKCQDCAVKLQGGGNPGKPCYPYLHLFLCRNCKEKRECESE